MIFFKLMKIVPIFFLILLASCVSSRFESIEKVTKIAAARKMSVKIYHTKNFDIFTLGKISDPKKSLRIYIEGDGRAYINRYEPSSNPTPSSFLVELMAQDVAPNILYIARPCQYVESEKCEEKYWTSERFSAEAIAAISEVVDNFSDKKLELIGYSGGATIINHLSQKNIKNIRTIAGNLDLEKFVKLHKISALSSPDIDYERLAKIPQIHFVGAQDKIVPLEIFESYQEKLSKKNCVTLKILSQASHQKNWQSAWVELLAKEPLCN